MPFFTNMAKEIVRKFHPRTVLDVGCAMGYLVLALRDEGVEAYGIDISEYAVGKVREDIRPYCRVWSALDPLPDDFPKFYDLVTNIEVAEHLPEEDGMRLIRNLCSYTGCIIFSSTPDDYAEQTHVNVQKSEYWARIFAQNNFYKDLAYDTGYIAPQACCLQKQQKTIPEIVEEYEKNIRYMKDAKKEQQSECLKLNEELTQSNAVLCRKIESMREEINSSSQTATALRLQVDELVSTNQRIGSEAETWKAAYNDISGSTSWKLTKPLRLVSAAFKKEARPGKRP